MSITNLIVTLESLHDLFKILIITCEEQGITHSDLKKILEEECIQREFQRKQEKINRTSEEREFYQETCIKFSILEKSSTHILPVDKEVQSICIEILCCYKVKGIGTNEALELLNQRFGSDLNPKKTEVCINTLDLIVAKYYGITVEDFMPENLKNGINLERIGKFIREIDESITMHP